MAVLAGARATMTGVSRRRRNKPARTEQQPGGTRPARRDHGARVTVDEPTWQAFKQITAGSSIGQVLGELVTRHVHHQQARQAKDGQLEDPQLLDALERAQQLQHDLSYLVRRIEDRLARPAGQPPTSPSPGPVASLPFLRR